MPDCVFCRISDHKIQTKLVYESNNIIAFEDLYPDAKIHVLIIPKKHISSLSKVSDSDVKILGELLQVCKIVAAKSRVDKTGYRTLINTGNDAGQVVKHLHIHLLGGEKLKPIN